MTPKLYAHGKQLCRKRMSYDSVRACPEDSKKAPPSGELAKPEKIKPRAFPRLNQPWKIPGTLIYYKKRFYTAP